MGDTGYDALVCVEYHQGSPGPRVNWVDDHGRRQKVASNVGLSDGLNPRGWRFEADQARLGIRQRN